MRALEEAGFIKGYHAEIDRHKIGLGVLAFVRVDTERVTHEATRKLEDAIRKLPEVIVCHYISGTGTFELQVVAQDLDSFSTLRAPAPHEPAQRERPAHQLLAGRGKGQQRAAAGASRRLRSDARVLGALDQRRSPRLASRIARNSDPCPHSGQRRRLLASVSPTR